MKRWKILFTIINIILLYKFYGTKTTTKLIKYEYIFGSKKKERNRKKTNFINNDHDDDRSMLMFYIMIMMMVMIIIIFDWWCFFFCFCYWSIWFPFIFLLWSSSSSSFSIYNEQKWWINKTIFLFDWIGNIVFISIRFLLLLLSFLFVSFNAQYERERD